jgi:Domain of unknown function (DUF4386)
MLLVFAVGNAIAVALLSAAFGWPAVLGEPAAVALPMFAANQAAIVTGFYLFALLSVLLVPISLGFHRLTSSGGALLAPTVTAFGILAGVFQLMGWIRWPFAVPDLARSFLDPATSAAGREATASSYELINSYAGAGLGEHLGWLFQAGWGVGIAVLILRTGAASRGLAITGGVLTATWALPFLLGPAVPVLGGEIIATIGFVAYALWFVWNGAIAVSVLRRAR